MPNPVTWFEIIGRDAEKLQSFYKDVFDWKMTPPGPKEFGVLQPARERREGDQRRDRRRDGGLRSARLDLRPGG